MHALTADTTAFPPIVSELLTTEYALLVLFAVFLLEGAMLMYFMPSELIVPGALFLMGDNWAVPIIIIAVAGATVGQYGLFLVAKRGGRKLLISSRWIPVTRDRIERYDRWLERWGPAAVVLSNTLLFTRGMVTVPAGIGDMSDTRFVVSSAVGTLSFETVLAALYLWASVRL